MTGQRSHPYAFLFDPRIRRLAQLACALLLGGWCVYVVLFDKGYDFYAYYVGAAGFLRDINVYAANADGRAWWDALGASLGVPADFAFPYRYPPLTALLVAPLLALPPTAAYALWSALNALCFLLCAWLIDRALPQRSATPWLALLMTLPVLTTLHAGQVNALLLLAFALVLYGSRNRRPLVVGAAVAFGAHVKFLPLICLPWLLWRAQWTAVLSAAAFLVALGLLCLLIVDLDVLLQVPGYVLAQVDASSAAVQNQSLGGTIRRLFEPNQAPALFAAPALWPWALRLVEIIVAGLCVAALWPPGANRNDPLEPALLVLVALLLTPLIWYHGYALMVLPVAAAAHAAATERNRAQLFAILAALATITVHGAVWKHSAGLRYVTNAWHAP